MTSPLCLLMPVLPGTSPDSIGALLAESQASIDAALSSIGTVHYARFALLDRAVPNLQPVMSNTPSDSLVIGVITDYDGSFDAYIEDFVAQLGEVFDGLLKFVKDGAGLIPVKNNVAAFEAFIKLNDASQHQPNTGLYSAYQATVQQILAST